MADAIVVGVQDASFDNLKDSGSQEGEQLLRRVPEVDLVMGPHHVNRIDQLLDQVDLGSQVCAVEPIHIMEDVAKPRRDSDISAWVNVIYGCNECCTYCVVPSTRGQEQSRDPDSIRREIMALGGMELKCKIIGTKKRVAIATTPEDEDEGDHLATPLNNIVRMEVSIPLSLLFLF